MEKARTLTLNDEVEWLALLERIPVRDLGHYPKFARVYKENGLSKKTAPFYVGHMVHDPDAYQGLMGERQKKDSGLPHGDPGFFPTCRGGLE